MDGIRGHSSGDWSRRMDRDRGTEGPGSGRKSERPMRLRCGLLAGLLAPLSACVGASPPSLGYEAPRQDSLATVIRNIRAGEDAAAMAGAAAAAARIAPEHLDGTLRDAMTHALALAINAEDSVLAEIGSMLEDALGAVWTQEELEATMREIPSEMGLPTARQTVAARLVGRLDAGGAGDDLLAAMAEAFTSIAHRTTTRCTASSNEVADRVGEDIIPQRSSRASFAPSLPVPKAT